MSHIRFWSPGSLPRLISGCERAHMALVLEGISGQRGLGGIRVALEKEPACRLIARMHAQVELCPWVRPEHTQWLAGLIRESCETTVRVDAAVMGVRGLAAYRESLLRVGGSAYGRADLDRRGDRQGPVQSWWSLCEWLRRGTGDPLVMSYSVTDWPAALDARGWQRWLEEHHAHMEWSPDTWDDWEVEP